MIKPDQAPDESAGPHPPAKAEREQDLVFLQRCFKETLSGEIENWPVEVFREYNQTLSRLAALLETPALTYVERIAGAAIVEISKKISASWKGRKMDQLVTGRKH